MEFLVWKLFSPCTLTLSFFCFLSSVSVLRSQLWVCLICTVVGGFSAVQSFSRVRLFVTPWTAARQASLCITTSWSLLKLMSTESVMATNHVILCCPLLLLSSIFPSIRVFFSESGLHIRWPKYWSFSHHQSFQWIFRTDLL